jgi:hypothetical protein
VEVDVNDTAKITRAIRLNTVAGVAMLASVALAIGLVLVGAFQWDAGMTLPLGMAAMSGSFALLIAWSMRKDRDDPAGIERRDRRLAAAFVVWGAALLVVATVAVAGIIAWGLLR